MEAGLGWQDPVQGENITGLHEGIDVAVGAGTFVYAPLRHQPSLMEPESNYTYVVQNVGSSDPFCGNQVTIEFGYFDDETMLFVPNLQKGQRAELDIGHLANVFVTPTDQLRWASWSSTPPLIGTVADCTSDHVHANLRLDGQLRNPVRHAFDDGPHDETAAPWMDLGDLEAPVINSVARVQSGGGYEYWAEVEDFPAGAPVTIWGAMLRTGPNHSHAPDYFTFDRFVRRDNGSLGFEGWKEYYAGSSLPPVSGVGPWVIRLEWEDEPEPDEEKPWAICVWDHECNVACEAGHGETDVQVSHLSAEKQNGEVRLRWRTTESSRAASFGVQRRVGNDRWQSLVSATIQAQERTHNYEFTDRLTDVPSGTAMVAYRLEVIEVSGRRFFTREIQVLFEKALALEVTPNPTRWRSKLLVRGPEPVPGTLSLYDLHGRRVNSWSITKGDWGNEVVEIAWNGTNSTGRLVTPGVYFARGEFGGQRVSQKLTVVR